MLNRYLDVAYGTFLEEIPEITANTKIYKFKKEEKTLYALVEMRQRIHENEIIKALYVTSFGVDIVDDEARAFVNRNDIKLFIYGEHNEFINSVIQEAEILNRDEPDNITYRIRTTFEEIKRVEFIIDYEILFELGDFGIGDKVITEQIPSAKVRLETGEEVDIQIKNIDCTNTENCVEFINGKLQLTNKAFNKQDYLPVLDSEVTSFPINVTVEIDDIDIVLEKYIKLNILNTKLMRQNLEDSAQTSMSIMGAVVEVDNKTMENASDIELIAEAIFELDEMINNQSHVARAAFDMKRGLSIFELLWLRWITTGRKTIEQCPEMYRANIQKQL